MPGRHPGCHARAKSEPGRIRREPCGGYCEYPDLEQRIQFWDAYLSERAKIQDDSIPIAYLSEMDQGLYGGLLGGEVRFLCDPETGWISSMVPPILRDWSDFEGLAYRPEHPWFQRYLRQLDVFTEAARGRFGISHFILISGLNFVFELLGATQTYLDLIDRPDAVSRHRAWIRGQRWRAEGFLRACSAPGCGTCSNMVQWIPGRVVSESVDPFHMTSVDYFERWGAETSIASSRALTRRTAPSRQRPSLLDAVASVRGLKAVFLADDIGYQSAFEFLGQASASVAICRSSWASTMPISGSSGGKSFAGRRLLQSQRRARCFNRESLHGSGACVPSLRMALAPNGFSVVLVDFGCNDCVPLLDVGRRCPLARFHHHVKQ